MQNNFQQQNMLVNQVPVGHLIQQNNGIVGNAMPHDNPMVQHNNLMETQQIQGIPQQQPQNSLPRQSQSHEPPQVVTRQRLQDLVREIDQTLNLDDDVEEMLLSYVDEFVDRCLNGAALIAKNRQCKTIEVTHVQQFLNRNYSMWTPGFGTDELKPYKRSMTTEAHKQRTALIKKTTKKY